MDTETFNECLDSGKFSAMIQAQSRTASTMGVQSTPSVLINGWPVIGAQPFEVFQQVIEDELRKAGQ